MRNFIKYTIMLHILIYIFTNYMKYISQIFLNAQWHGIYFIYFHKLPISWFFAIILITKHFLIQFVILFLLVTNECERGIDKLGTPPLLWSRLHCYHSGKWFMKEKNPLFFLDFFLKITSSSIFFGFIVKDYFLRISCSVLFHNHLVSFLSTCPSYLKDAGFYYKFVV